MLFDSPAGARRVRDALPRFLSLALLLATLACGGAEGSNATGSPAVNSSSTGSLVLSVSGLPSGSAPLVTVSGPSGYSRSLASAETITGLSPGSYDVVAGEISAGGDRFSVEPATTTATVAARTATTVSLDYAIRTGSLAIGVAGLPAGAAPSLIVTGPDGFSRTLTAAGTISGLAPGSYSVAVAPVSIDQRTFASDVPKLDLSVSASLNPTPVAVTYRLASGALLIDIQGLPSGATASALVEGPGGFRRTVVHGDTLGRLVPGSYAVTADPVTVTGDVYRTPGTMVLEVLPASDPVPAAVRYALATGRLDLAIGGLPNVVLGSVVITGPSGFSQAATASLQLAGLAPGEYTVTSSTVVTAAASYAPAVATARFAVTAAPTPVPVTVSYALSTGSIAFVVSGLGPTLPAAIAVAGPNGFSASVPATSTLTNLRPGAYTLTAAAVTTGSHTYTATPATLAVTVAASLVASPAAFAYALSTGGIAVSVTGLPNNVASAITVTGPGDYSRAVTSTTLLLGLTPGTYTIAAATVSSGSAYWAPAPASQTVAITPSTSATSVSVSYTTATGSLAISVNGLGAGVNGSVGVSGPNGYARSISGTTTLAGLVQGQYTVAAASVTSGSTTYTPSPSSQNVSVGTGTSAASLTYTGSGSPPPPPPPSNQLNLTIDGLHVQQVVQAYGGSVPLVAGRDGLLRVFVKANISNSAAPPVRVRFYSGATLASTVTINAPVGAVPTTLTEGTLTSSWNYGIPASLMQPGLKILADVDPNGTVTESSESDNSFPVSGTAATMDVRSVPTFSVTLVPVLQSVNSLQGNVTTGNATQFLSTTRQLYPLGAIDADVRAPFTTSAPVLQSNDGNGGWNQVLSEINALRTADGSARFYYGVVKVGYTSGIAGLGYVPGRAAIGWDYLGSAEGVMAHELGHNFGRFHAPSCGAGGADPSYPYTGGAIGNYGYDATSGTLKAPTVTDLMGYCNSVWISDYTYNAVLNYRASNPFMAAAVLGGNHARPGLLVWGRVQHGQLILEPSFEVVAPPSLPQRSGGTRIQAFGAMGESLIDFSFDGKRIADLPDATARQFAFVIPLDAMRGAYPTRLRLSTAGQQAEVLSTAPASGTIEPVLERTGPEAVRLTWRDAATRGVLVRDGRSGQILAFARGGQAIVHTREATLDLTTSDGVRGVRRRVAVSPAGSPPPPRR
ncbi:MAG: hypothetical protein ABIZ91_16910 [Gemmatimonadaceae bacterium]